MDLLVGCTTLRGSPAFATLFRFAAERQRVFFDRRAGKPFPWTDDPILRTYRFTNTYRVLDRTSQFLIAQVLAVPTDEISTALRVLVFKVFNRIESWRLLERELGTITVESFNARHCAHVLETHRAAGERVYSAAYLMPNPSFGHAQKHANHLELIARLIADGTLERLAGARSLRSLYRTLLEVHSFGVFLAYQFAIDLNYSPLFPFDEGDFVTAGPGARDGIRKCFSDGRDLPPEAIIEAVAERAPAYFDALDLEFRTLGARPLQLVDWQNLFCEVGKYARVAHPDLPGTTRRRRLKRRFWPSTDRFELIFPSRWGLLASDLAPD